MARKAWLGVVVVWLGIGGFAPAGAAAANVGELPRRHQPAWRAQVRSLVADLRDDDVAWNATNASHQLWEMRSEAAPWLREALHSQDRQQRQLAAEILRAVRQVPSETLLRACVEALEHDSAIVLRESEDNQMLQERLDLGIDAATHRRAQGIPLGNAGGSVVWFLADHERIRLAAPLLAGQLDSVDPQASFLSAYLLAHIGGGAWRSVIVPMMVASLADNEICGDALLAVQALARLGVDALPELRIHVLRIDGQAEMLLRHVIASIAGEDDADAVTLSLEIIREIGFAFDPLEERECLFVPYFPAGWRFVPYRASLEELPAAAD